MLLLELNCCHITVSSFDHPCVPLDFAQAKETCAQIANLFGITLLALQILNPDLSCPKAGLTPLQTVRPPFCLACCISPGTAPGLHLKPFYL